MFSIPALVTSAWLLQSAMPAPEQVQSPVAPAAPARELVVVAAAPVYLPDGSIRSETIALPTTGRGLVHLYSRKTLCAPAVGDATEPTDAAFGWRIVSQVVARTDSDVVISIDWRRLWDGGKKIGNGPGGTVQLTLHAGDRIPLDHIANNAPSVDCRAVGLGLEVKMARTSPAPVPGTTQLPLGSTPGGAKPVDAELWLTHTSPSGSQQIAHQVIRLSEAGGRFAFAPTPVTTSRGDLSLELAGTVDRFRTTTGDEFMSVSLNRMVTGGDVPAPGLSARTAVSVPMELEKDVLFELMTAVGGPRGGGGGGRGGARGGGGGRGGAGAGAPGATGPAANGTVNLQQLATLLEGHQFSLRVRVEPVK